jgi:hypothetical protein
MRRWWLLLPAGLGLLLVASVTFTRGRTLAIVDSEGRPQVAYSVYRHQGSRLNPAHPVSYDARPPTLVRSDSAGRLRLPSAVHVHLPFPLQTGPRLWVEVIYVPALHNAGGRIGGDYTAGDYTASAEGEWEMAPGGNRAVVFDLSGRPERWQATLSTLSFFLGSLVAPSRRAADRTEASAIVELIGHFRQEYEAFLARWGETLRPRPAMPRFLAEYERQGWMDMIDRDLRERPTWGGEIRRLYEREVAYLTEVAATLPP